MGRMRAGRGSIRGRGTADILSFSQDSNSLPRSTQTCTCKISDAGGLLFPGNKWFLLTWQRSLGLAHLKNVVHAPVRWLHWWGKDRIGSL